MLYNGGGTKVPCIQKLYSDKTTKKQLNETMELRKGGYHEKIWRNRLLGSLCDNG